MQKPNSITSLPHFRSAFVAAFCCPVAMASSSYASNQNKCDHTVISRTF